MIIWRGLGIIVAIVVVMTLALTEYAVEAMSGDNRYYQIHEWPKLIGSFVAGLVVLVIGRVLNDKSDREAKVVIDKETGAEIVLKVEHSLFFINVKYWGYIIFALGIIFFSFRAAATPVTAQQRKSDRPHSKNIRRKHRTATYPEHYGSVWDQANKPSDNYPTECVIYGGKSFFSPGEDPTSKRELSDLYGGDFFAVRISGNSYYFQAMKDFATVTKSIAFPESFWEEFWKEVERAKLKDWELLYIPQNDVQPTDSKDITDNDENEDEFYWGIRIKYRGRLYESAGINAYPDENDLSRSAKGHEATAQYKTIMRALTKLLGLWDGFLVEMAAQKPAPEPKPMTEAERAELYERLKGVEPASPEKQNFKFCKSCLPEKLRITSGAIGGILGDVHYVELRGRRLYYEKGRAVGKPVKKFVTPTKRQWASFWQAVQEAQLHRWADNYFNYNIIDGSYWKIEIQSGGKRLKSEGTNGYPDDKNCSNLNESYDSYHTYTEFMNAVRKLVGGGR